MRARLVGVARRAALAEQPVQQDPRAAAAVAVHHAQGRIRQQFVGLSRLVGAGHHALKACVPGEPTQRLVEEGPVVRLRNRVEQVDRGCVAFPASRRRHAGLTPDGHHLHTEPVAGEGGRDRIEPHAVAPDHHEVRQRQLAAQEGYRDLAVGLDDLGVARDPDEAVRSAECGDASAALPHGIGGEAPGGSAHQPDQQVLESPALGQRLLGQPRRDHLARARSGSRKLSDHWGHELVEGEDRRRRKSRQDHHRQAPTRRQADRLAGLESHAVDHDSGVELGHDAAVQVTLALRRAPGHEDQVRALERPPQCGPQRSHVVAERPQELRLTAQLADGVGEDAPVTVVDEARPHGLAGLDQLVARRQDRDPGPAHDLDVATTDRGEDAGFAGGEPGASEQHGLAAADVGARKRESGAGDTGTAHDEHLRLDVRGLHRHDGVGSARQHPAGGDGGRGARSHLRLRRHGRRDRLRVEAQPNRLLLAGAVGVLGAHGESVHVRAVETGDVDLRPDVLGEHPPQGVGERQPLAREPLGVDGGAPAPLRLVAVEYVEKLLLPHDPASAASSSS